MCGINIVVVIEIFVKILKIICERKLIFSYGDGN